MKPTILACLVASLTILVARSSTQVDGDPGRATTEEAVVAPGLVRWHADLEAAKTAAAKTGKPILVFQLLGRLDERFC